MRKMKEYTNVDVEIRNGMVFVMQLSDMPVCDCGSLTCEIAETFINQMSEPHICVAEDCCKEISI